MTHLAIAIAALDSDSALTAMQQAAAVADLVELRLDLMRSFDLPRLLKNRPLPVIVTCRPEREGGAWLDGDEPNRLSILRQASLLGAEYVDLEWDVDLDEARLNRSRTRIIRSRHDFNQMLPNLPQLAAEMIASGADIVKMVGTAQRLADTAPVFEFLAQTGVPAIAIAMGPAGLLTRLLAFRYSNAFLSFAAPDPLRDPKSEIGNRKSIAGTAPGQIRGGAMQQVYRIKAMSQATTLIGLLAPDANSSPLIVEGNAWLAGQGLDAVLMPLEPAPKEPAARAAAALRQVLPLHGYLVEPPFGDVDLCFQAGDERHLRRAGPLAARLQTLLTC